MKTKRFRHKNIEREFIVFGTGPRILYAFHGFGRSAYDWEVFSDWLSSEFTVYSFHDFFHGKTEQLLSKTIEEPLVESALCAYFEAFSRKERHEIINLMAYSSGGRTALTLMEKCPTKLNEVWLFAPDGIKISFWNNLFCKSRLTQKVFRRIVNKPFFFFYLAKVLSKMNLLNRSLSSFVLFNMRSKFKREQVYNYWMLYKDIRPSMKNVISSVKSNKIKLHLIVGKDDAVIDAEIGNKLQRKLKEQFDITLLEGGHQLITKKHLDFLKKQFAGK